MSGNKYEDQENRRLKKNIDEGYDAGRPYGWDNWSDAERAEYWNSLPVAKQREFAKSGWAKDMPELAAQGDQGRSAQLSAEEQARTGQAADKQSASNKDKIAYAGDRGNEFTLQTEFGASTMKTGKGAPGTTFAPEGIDQTNMGVGEQLWDNRQDDFFAPGRAEGYMDANKSTFAQPGFGETVGKEVSDRLGEGGAGTKYWEGLQGKYGKGGPSYVQDAYKGFDAAVDPNLGGYYDRAFQQASQGINKQLAARGQFGSSAGMQQLGNVATGLNAERANREAAYGLDRFRTQMGAASAASGDELSWTQGLGDIAFKAGDENRAYLGDRAAVASGVQSQEQGRVGQGFGQASVVDSFNLQNRNSGFANAFEAQGKRDNRIQQGFDNQIGFGAVLAGMGGSRIEGNYNALTSEAGTGMASATDSGNMSAAAAERQYQEALEIQRQAALAANSFAPKPADPRKKVP